jgi:hypothetical protein
MQSRREQRRDRKHQEALEHFVHKSVSFCAKGKISVAQQTTAFEVPHLRAQTKPFAEAHALRQSFGELFPGRIASKTIAPNPRSEKSISVPSSRFAKVTMD